MGWFHKTTKAPDVDNYYRLKYIRKQIEELRELRDEIDKLKGVTLTTEQRYDLVRELMEKEAYLNNTPLTKEARIGLIAFALTQDDYPTELNVTQAGGIQIHYGGYHDSYHKMFTIFPDGGVDKERVK